MLKYASYGLKLGLMTANLHCWIGNRLKASDEAKLVAFDQLIGVLKRLHEAWRLKHKLRRRLLCVLAILELDDLLIAVFVRRLEVNIFERFDVNLKRRLSDARVVCRATSINTGVCCAQIAERKRAKAKIVIKTKPKIYIFSRLPPLFSLSC